MKAERSFWRAIRDITVRLSLEGYYFQNGIVVLLVHENDASLQLGGFHI